MERILFTVCLFFTFVLSQETTSSAWSIDKGPSEDVNGITFFHTPMTSLSMTSSSDDSKKQTSGLLDNKLITFSHFRPDHKRLSKAFGLSRTINQAISTNTDVSSEEPGTNKNFKTSGRTSDFDNIPTLYMPSNNFNKETVDKKQDDYSAIDTDNVFAHYKPVGDLKPPVASEIFDFSAFNNDISDIDNTAQTNSNADEPLETMNSINYDFSQLGLAGTNTAAKPIDNVNDNNIFGNGLFSSENPSSDGSNIANTDTNNGVSLNPFEQGSNSLNSQQDMFDSAANINDVQPDPFGQLNNEPAKLLKNGPVFSAKKEFTDHSRKPMLFVKSAFVDTSGRQNPNMKPVSGFIDASTDEKFPQQKTTTTNTTASTPTTTTTKAPRVSTTTSSTPSSVLSSGGNNNVDLTEDPNKTNQGSGKNRNLNVDILYPPAPFPDKIHPIENQDTNRISQSGMGSLNKKAADMNAGMLDRVTENPADAGLEDYDMYSDVQNGIINAVDEANSGNLNSHDGNSFDNSNTNIPLKPVSNDNIDIFRTETNVQLINTNFDSSDKDKVLAGNQNLNGQRVDNQAIGLQTQPQSNIIQSGVGNVRNTGFNSANRFQNQGNQMVNSGNFQTQNTPLGSRPGNIQNSNVQNNPNQAGNQMIPVNNNILTGNGDSFTGSSQSKNFFNQQNTMPSNNGNQMVTDAGSGISTVIGATRSQSISGTRQNLLPTQMPRGTNDITSLGSNPFTQNQWKGGQSSGQQFSNVDNGQFRSPGNGANNQDNNALINNMKGAQPKTANDAGLINNGFNGQTMINSQGPTVTNNNNNNNNKNSQLLSNNINSMSSATNNNMLTPIVNGNSATNFNQQLGSFSQNVVNKFGTVQNGGQNIQSNQNVLTRQNMRNSANTGNIVPNGQIGMTQTNISPNNGGTSGNVRNVMSNGLNGFPQQNTLSRFGTNAVNSQNGQMTNIQQNSFSTNMVGNTGNVPRGFNNNNIQQNGQQFGQFNNGQVQRQPGNLGNGMNTFRNVQNPNIPMNSNQFNNVGVQPARSNPPQMRINAGPTNPSVFNGPNIRPNFIPNNGLNVPRPNPFRNNVPAFNVNQIRQNSFNGGRFMPFR